MSAYPYDANREGTCACRSHRRRGVVVGAVASGAVQAALARAERRRDGRNAARVLYMQLHDAEKAVSDLRALRDWAEMITDWDAYAETWAQYRDPLASVLNTNAFAKVVARLRVPRQP
jgi:hypothetical protein